VKLTLGKMADWIHAEGDFDDRCPGDGVLDRLADDWGGGAVLRGARGAADGHDFVEAALANGAVAAVVSMRWLPPAGMDAGKLLRVPDHDGGRRAA
jgi:UDP-N-acetylmuramoyl-tripeptide--D-alanyl-D-alanine ligase